MIDLGGDDRGWRGPSSTFVSLTPDASEQWQRTVEAAQYKEPEAEPQIEYVTGYPFMQLAKRHGLDYGDVLITAQWMTEHPTQLTFEAEEYVRQHLCKIPGAVAHKIYKLISQPAYLRGAVGHDVI